MSGGTLDRATWLERYRSELIEAGANDWEVARLCGRKGQHDECRPDPVQAAKDDLAWWRSGS